MNIEQFWNRVKDCEIFDDLVRGCKYGYFKKYYPEKECFLAEDMIQELYICLEDYLNAADEKREKDTAVNA